MMNRYHVITRKISSQEHLNFEELLPASCSYINGIFVTAFGKKEMEREEFYQALSFPQVSLTSLAYNNLNDLFYTYLRTRTTKLEAQAYFVSDMLPLFVDTLSMVEYSDNVSLVDQDVIKSNIVNALTGNDDYQGFTDYLFTDIDIYNSVLDKYDYIKLILNSAIKYLYKEKSSIFYHTSQRYVQPKDVEVGNVTLLVNGNNFILRDYAVVANRKLKKMSKEVLTLNEPLDVNSSLKVVFKNTIANEVFDELTVKIYIQYEHKRITT